MKTSCLRMVNAHLLCNKLRELKQSGIDLDKLPNDLKLHTVMQLTPEEAQQHIIDREAILDELVAIAQDNDMGY